MISYRFGVRGFVALGLLLATSSANAQTVSTPSPPATRAIIFSPDSSQAQLEFHGIAVVDGIWKEGWIPVCVGPCAQDVPVAERYRVGGNDIHGSRKFEIGPGRQPLLLETETGSQFGFVVGTVATSVGGAAVLGGLLVAGFAGFCGMSDQPGACASRDTQEAIGLAVAGMGAAAIITGMVLLFGNRTVVYGNEPRR